MTLKHSLIRYLSFILLGISFINCEQQNNSANSEILKIDTAAIRRNLIALSSDAFEGRKPFTIGEEKTINYLKNEMANIGLKPGNGESYFQKVPMVEITANPSETMTVSGANSNLSFKAIEDFVVVTQRATEFVELKASELVFAGFGTTAPEYGWADYDGIEWAGKTAVVLVNDPGFVTQDSSLFKGNTMTYYGRWTYKYEEGAKQGADGVILIHETASAGYGWNVVENSWSGANLTLEDNNQNMSKLAIESWITLSTAEEIFTAAGLDLSEQKIAATQRGFKPVALGLKVDVSINNGIKRDNSQNVIGVIPGSERPNETIVYSAHWDHLGIGEADANGDSIYNGALDNASGTAQMLAIAQAFMSQNIKPKRTIVFLAVTAEEQGLLGSAYYAENPLFPINTTVCNINMDGSAVYGKMKDFTITGIGHSQMDEYAKEEAEKLGRYINPDPDPDKGYFFRSDHFNFAKQGVPALYGKGIYDHKEKGIAYITKMKTDYLQNRYHRQADNFKEELFSMEGIAEEVRLLYNIGKRLADETRFPKWYESSEFNGIRK
jgi:Zn-dependent M28 family amino/carboxypeptidase